MVKELLRLIEINEELLKVLTKTSYDILKYAKEHNIDIPDLSMLFNEARQLIHEQHSIVPHTKYCSLCNKLNPNNAIFCCYCGSSLVITRMRQNDESPSNATEGAIESFI